MESRYTESEPQSVLTCPGRRSGRDPFPRPRRGRRQWVWVGRVVGEWPFPRIRTPSRTVGTLEGEFPEGRPNKGILDGTQRSPRSRDLKLSSSFPTCRPVSARRGEEVKGQPSAPLGLRNGVLKRIVTWCARHRLNQNEYFTVLLSSFTDSNLRLMNIYYIWKILHPWFRFFVKRKIKNITSLTLFSLL